MERNPVALEAPDPAYLASISTAELQAEVIRRAANYALNAPSGEVAREFKLAITHTEDATTRFNKGVYMLNGTFAISDAERAGPPPPAPSV